MPSQAKAPLPDQLGFGPLAQDSGENLGRALGAGIDQHHRISRPGLGLQTFESHLGALGTLQAPQLAAGEQAGNGIGSFAAATCQPSQIDQ